MPRAEIPAGVEQYVLFELPPLDRPEMEPVDDGGDWLKVEDVPKLYAHWLEQLKEEGEVAVCHACGYIDDPCQSSCSNCDAQMQRLPSALIASIRRDCLRQLKEELLSDRGLAAAADGFELEVGTPDGYEWPCGSTDEAMRPAIEAALDSIPIEEGGDG